MAPLQPSHSLQFHKACSDHGTLTHPPSLFSKLQPSAHYFLLFPTQLGRLYFYHPAWSILLFIFPCSCSYFPIMQYSSQLTGSDDNSDTSTNIPDVFSHNTTNNSLDNTSEPDSINNLVLRTKPQHPHVTDWHSHWTTCTKEIQYWQW